MRGRTTIVISHTLTSVRDATSIVVLDAGRVVEHGSPDELAALDGAYSRLLQLQASVAREPGPVTA
jgi:ABC-type multidrug transport system fused ATPase/permease subunit